MRINNELKDWKHEAGATRPIMYRLNYFKNELTIFTSQPGWLIGKAGCLVNKYMDVINKKLGYDFKVLFVGSDKSIYHWDFYA